MRYPRLIIAGTNSGVGKTTIALGIMLALGKMGLHIQPFKAGPDYIDPTYHTYATGNICCNLDSWLLSRNSILELFQRRAKDADVSVIEGVMGLYDGVRDNERGSTANLAKILNCPVILILNASSLSRSAAAIVLGYSKFDRDVEMAGVILNNIKSEGHYRYIKGPIESKTGIPVLGYLPKDSNLKLPERHLGLIPAQEEKLRIGFFKRLLNLAEKNIDIDRILTIARQSRMLPYGKRHIFGAGPIKNYVTIAIARDKAFHFYYRDNLDILRHFGARLIEFSPLDHKELPRGADGVYIGGGFPELFASQLSKNISLRKKIYQGGKGGLPIYAECGGLMYLVEKLIDFEKREFPMVGILSGSVLMGSRLQALGYVTTEAIKDNIISKRGDKNRAHIFHWSYLDDLPRKKDFAFKLNKDKGRTFLDGLTNENVLGSYAHFHFASNVNLARNFITSCREYRRRNG